MTVDSVKLEKLKVWYSVFGVLVDAWRDGEYTDAVVLQKLAQLKDELELEIQKPS